MDMDTLNNVVFQMWRTQAWEPSRAPRLEDLLAALFLHGVGLFPPPVIIEFVADDEEPKEDQ